MQGALLSSAAERSVSQEINANGHRTEIERFEPRVTYRQTSLGVTRVAFDFLVSGAAPVDAAWARA